MTTTDRASPPSSSAPAVPRSRHAPGVAGLVLLAIVLSPLALASAGLVGERWLVFSDWASLVHRVSEVGGPRTPLVGPYSFHGWAHPGPLLYYAAAPLYRLSGGDPRSLLWTGALINAVCVVALAAVAWRRGRWTALLAMLAGLSLLLHAMGPAVARDLWNPYVGILPLALAVALVVDAALGRRAALAEAAVPATFALQAHLAFASLLAAVVVWYVAWRRWSPGLVPGAPEDAGRPATQPVPASARRRERVLVAVTLVLWIPPAVDALVGRHNPVRIARSMLHPGDVVGLTDAPQLVGQYLAPTGPLLTGHGALVPSTRAIDVVWFLAAAGAMAACVALARRHRSTDVAALATLTLVLVLASVPATARLITPTPTYLTEWLKVIAALLWSTVAWTVWRVVSTRPTGLPVAHAIGGAAAVAAIVAAAASSWGVAIAAPPPHEGDPALVGAVRRTMDQELADGATYRIEVVGDVAAHYDGLLYYLIRDGHDVVTASGASGDKWGPDHRWERGDPVEATFTITVHVGFSRSTALRRCLEDRGEEPILEFDGIDDDDRRWLERLGFRRLTDPDGVTTAEIERARQLRPHDVRVVVFRGDHVCGRPSRRA